MYVTFLASSFRTLRFGLNAAHAKGMALQLNHLLDSRRREGQCARRVLARCAQDEAARSPR